MRQTSRRGFLKKLALSDGKRVSAPRKTLVCVFLRGGADTLNMFVPYADDTYYKIRQSIAIAPPRSSGSNASTSLKLNDFYSLHPKMATLYPMYADGRLAVVEGVGSDNPTGSHFESQDQMEHGEAYRRIVGGGWLARHLRVRAGDELTPLSAVSIGPTIPESLRGAPNASAITSIDDVRIRTSSADTRDITKALSRMYQADVDLLAAPGNSTLVLLKKVEALRSRDYKPAGGAEYPSEGFGRGLNEIARLIKADVGLEVACIDLDGWDTHFVQGGAEGLQASNIELLSKGLSAFGKDLQKRIDDVVVLVITEFGRRTYENGSLGTDHGRGFAAMIIGGCVNGGKIFGAWPGLDEERWTLGPGGMRVLHDYRSVLAEVLNAVGNRRTTDVFPGFRAEPIGVMKSDPT